MNETHFRHCMLYKFQKVNNASKITLDINEVHGNGSLDIWNCQRWFIRFQAGHLNLMDNECVGRPLKDDMAKLIDLVESEPTLTTHELAIKLNSSSSTIHRHLKTLGKVSKLGKWVPHELTPLNLSLRLNICSSLLSRQHKQLFWIESSLLMRNGFFIIILNEKDNG